jgi:hypothetical protein
MNAPPHAHHMRRQPPLSPDRVVTHSTPPAPTGSPTPIQCCTEKNASVGGVFEPNAPSGNIGATSKQAQRAAICVSSTGPPLNQTRQMHRAPPSVRYNFYDTAHSIHSRTSHAAIPAANFLTPHMFLCCHLGRWQYKGVCIFCMWRGQLRRMCAADVNLQSRARTNPQTKPSTGQHAVM